MYDDRGSTGGAADRQPLTWRVRRASHNVFLALLVLLFQVVLSVAVYIYVGHPHGGLVFCFLFVALLPFYGTYRYVLGEELLEVFGPLYYAKYEWKQFDGWLLYEEEVRLHLKGQPQTHVVVLFAPGRVTPVLTHVQRHLPGMSLDDRRL